MWLLARNWLSERDRVHSHKISTFLSRFVNSSKWKIPKELFWLIEVNHTSYFAAIINSFLCLYDFDIPHINGITHCHFVLDSFNHRHACSHRVREYVDVCAGVCSHSFTERHLGWHHTLAIMNHTVRKREMQIFFKIMNSFPLNMHPEVRFLDHTVVWFLIFWDIFILLSTITVPIYTLTSST